MAASSSAQGFNPLAYEFQPIGNIQTDKMLQACEKGKIKIIRQYKNSFDVRDAGGRTPLMLAALSPVENVFNLVLKKTARDKLSAVDCTGRNALFYACVVGNSSRVEKLYRLGVKVIRGNNGSLAVEMTLDSKIHKLLGEDTQNLLDQQGAVLKYCFNKFGHDPKKFEHEVFERTGQRIVSTSLEKFSENKKVSKVGNDFFNQSLLQNEKVISELKKYFTENLPHGSDEVKLTIEKLLGWKPSTRLVRQLIKEHGIKTEKKILNSPDFLNPLVEHFTKNPPESVQKAIDFIKQEHGMTVKEEYMVRFLRYIEQRKKYLEKQ